MTKNESELVTFMSNHHNGNTSNNLGDFDCRVIFDPWYSFYLVDLYLFLDIVCIWFQAFGGRLCDFPLVFLLLPTLVSYPKVSNDVVLNYDLL